MKFSTGTTIDLFGIPDKLEKPSGYKGLAAFHKYWGKKPVDTLEHLVLLLSNPGDVIVDPFLGSGLLARYVALSGRRFIGIDINPISTHLSSLFVSPPLWKDYAAALGRLESHVKSRIEATYVLEDGRIATHYLWNQTSLTSVWCSGKRGTPRVELEPTAHDISVIANFKDYETKLIRPPEFFKNSRINMSESINFSDLFTGRALHNIDLFLEAIAAEPEDIRSSLLLTLTASIGQMSRMVFAITRRGKTSGPTQERTEVGSWVIGYWRPKVHFEINVYNTFFNRAKKLMRAIKAEMSATEIVPANSLDSFYASESPVCLVKADCRSVLKQMKPDSVALMITDPPHSDRIPYLELSEMWNCVLGQNSDFANEIVVSNALKRQKNKNTYNDNMIEFMDAATAVLQPGGLLVLMFNARDSKSWTYFRQHTNGQSDLKYLGAFPLQYSAGSVVQDNRGGALKHDYILVFVKNQPREGIEDRLSAMVGWQTRFPVDGD